MQLKAFKNQNIEEKKQTRMIQFGKNHVLTTFYFFTILLLIYLKIFLVRTKNNIRFKNDEYSI